MITTLKYFSQYFFKLAKVIFRGCPACGKANCRMLCVGLFPKAEAYLFRKSLHFFVFEQYELLVRGRFQKEAVALFLEDFLHFFRALYGVSAYLKIKPVCEKLIELYAEQPALC